MIGLCAKLITSNEFKAFSIFERLIFSYLRNQNPCLFTNTGREISSSCYIRKEDAMKDKREEQFYTLPTEEVNLSDFSLFLSVMKNKKAYECLLGTIMNEEIHLQEGKVEEVILNAEGKRAIRLDAWALDENHRQFDTEMQNHARPDDIRKRSRYYQGLMDVPILKSGKKTRYRYLPSTVIIFITQEDIFERNLAMYTFTEQCEEIQGFHLEDGTMKIFLNMKSRNGRPELISLLQYIKNSTLSNPDIILKDKRLLQLDAIVQAVKKSEEWEVVRMTIMEQGIKRGIEQGETIKLIKMIYKKQQKGKSVSIIAEELEEEPIYVEEICAILEQYETVPDWRKVCMQLWEASKVY